MAPGLFDKAKRLMQKALPTVTKIIDTGIKVAGGVGQVLQSVPIPQAQVIGRGLQTGARYAGQGMDTIGDLVSRMSGQTQQQISANSEWRPSSSYRRGPLAR